jgi:undecaprenyl-diphosphatase
MSSIASHILALPPWAVLLVVFALPALESSAFVGFVFPGEVALVLGGFLAYQGEVPLAAVLAAGIAGAIVGDSVGYVVGRAYGRRLLDGTVGRFVHHKHLDRAEAYLADRGAKAVFFGRFTAALRVMIPGLAGMARLRYRTFAAYNVAGAVGWGTMSVLFGYLGGKSWERVAHIASRVGLVALGVLVAAALAGYLLRRTGPDRFARLGRRVAASQTVVRTRSRFPRVTAWVIARLDPASGTGLVLTLALVVSVAAAWTFLGITQDVVGKEELALVDPRIHGWVLSHRTSALDAFFEVVTWLGASAVTLPVLAVTGAVLARRRRSIGPLLNIALVYGSAVLLRDVVVEVVRRPRPPVADWLVSAHGWSYPSGHTTQAFTAWILLALLLTRGSRPRTRVLAVAAAAAVGCLVAASRVYLGVHWATDVLAGAALATTVLATSSVFRRLWFPPELRSGRVP